MTQWSLWGASILAATASVVFVMRDRGQRSHLRLWLGAFTWVCVAVLLLEPARSGADYGQIEFVLMFVVVADVTVVPAPYRGLLIGIAAAIKLTPLIFIVLVCSSSGTGSLPPGAGFVLVLHPAGLGALARTIDCLLAS